MNSAIPLEAAWNGLQWAELLIQIPDGDDIRENVDAGERTTFTYKDAVYMVSVLEIRFNQAKLSVVRKL